MHFKNLRKHLLFYKVQNHCLCLEKFPAKRTAKMLQLNKDRNSLNVKDYTVIIPAVCVGNVAQLACDLLISSKQLKRIGTIHHPALIPIFGPAAYQHEPQYKVSACELYEGEEDKLLIIQFRTPFISVYLADFHKKLAQLLLESRRVIVLTASFGFEKRVIGGSPYEYKSNELFQNAHSTEISNAHWKPFTGEIIHGGGNALHLYNVLDKHNLSVLLLFRYVLEGDNTTDASFIIKELVGLYHNFLQLSQSKHSSDELKLIIPVSWKLLFGNDVMDLIF